MGKGIIRVSKSVLRDVLLLPENYTVDQAYVPYHPSYEAGYINVIVESDDIPTDPRTDSYFLPFVTPKYRKTEHGPELVQIDVERFGVGYDRSRTISGSAGKHQ